jgi:cysteine desulfurase
MSKPEPDRPIYLDYHATTPLDPRVREVLVEMLDAGPGNPHSRSHKPGWRAHDAVELARKQVAGLIGARAHEVIFTSGASEASNLAIQGVLGRAEPGRILCSAIEHPSVLETCRVWAERPGWTLELVPVTPDGVVDIKAFKKILGRQVRLVCVMLANNEIGTLQPVAEISALCRKAGVPLHCDAAQAAGRVPIDVGAMTVDLLALSGHKLHGPMGIGALYVRAGRQIAPLFAGGAQEAGLRPGTVPAPLAVAFGKACEIAAQEGLEEQARIADLRDRLLKLLKRDVPDLAVNGTLEARLAGNLNVSFPGVNAEDVLLAAPEIAASTGSACASGSQKPSHVLAALGLDAGRINGAVRIGLGRFTTHAEIDQAARALIDAYLSVCPPALAPAGGLSVSQ